MNPSSWCRGLHGSAEEDIGGPKLNGFKEQFIQPCLAGLDCFGGYCLISSYESPPSLYDFHSATWPHHECCKSFLVVQSVAKTGALCCVAAGPQDAKPGVEGGRDSSTDRGEPYWRTNSSFSPSPSRIWSCRLQSDVLSHAPNGSSLSSTSNGHKSKLGNGITSHHHSVSDGALSFDDSPPSIVKSSRWWSSPVQKFKVGDDAGPSIRGMRSETSPYPTRHSTESYPAMKSAALSPRFGSPSSLSEFGGWESKHRQPCIVASHNFSNRHSHTSKAVYPMVFHNPVSNLETYGADAEDNSRTSLPPSEGQILPSYLLENRLYSEDKFSGALAEIQKLETSPDFNTSSRREGFRWSNASSYDLGLDNGNREVRTPPYGTTTDKKCGVCGKLLQQKSPWSSHRILRVNDMPIAGVLPCGHVYHADCLEHMTPKAQIHDPPCPLCHKFVGPASGSESPYVKESLQTALRSIRKSKGVMIDEAPHDQDEKASANTKDSSNKKRPQVVPRWNIGGTSLRDRLKRHMLIKGRDGRDFHKSRVFHKAGSSSSMETVTDRVSCTSI